MIWLLLAIIAGLLLGKLMGFMAAEFVMRPVTLVVRYTVLIIGAVVGWGRRLP